MNVFLIPLWMLSGALFPVTDPHSWIYWAVLSEPGHLRSCCGSARIFMHQIPASAICPLTPFPSDSRCCSRSLPTSRPLCWCSDDRKARRDRFAAILVN